MRSAVLCRVNGWDVGSVLQTRIEGLGLPIRYRITALGVIEVLAQEWDPELKRWGPDESRLDLREAEWTPEGFEAVEPEGPGDRPGKRHG